MIMIIMILIGKNAEIKNGGTKNSIQKSECKKLGEMF